MRSLQGLKQQPHSHPASTVPQDSCEPRSKLMWSIVGQVSSVSWKDDKPADGADCQPTAAPAESNASGSTTVPVEGTDCAESSQAEETAAATPANPWGDLRPEMLVKIAAKAGTANIAQAMVSVCWHWRNSILEDHLCLRALRFPPPGSSLAVSRAIASGEAFPRTTGLPISLLLDKAAKAGNLGACVAVAQLLESLGMPESMRYWKKAAQLGSAKAQVVYGTAAYSGSRGVIRDSEEAYRWLTKASTKLASLPSSVANGALLAKAALHLGFLALDGEATKMDLESAVSWFRLASKYGSRDAEIALGTMLRTGQYGPS